MMRKICQRRRANSEWRLVLGVASALLFAFIVSVGRADLAHRYGFTSDVSDSVGDAHGAVVDAGGATAVFSAGQLDLSANAGELSNEIVEDAYVDLPNGLISSAASGGANGAITLEFWATVAEVRTWSRFGDFGTSDDGENSSVGGQNSDYILVTPNSGRVGGDGLEATNHPAGGPEPNAQDNVSGAVPFGVGVQRHVVAVYDHTNNSAGGTNGTMLLYKDGVFIDSDVIDPGIDLRSFDDNNNWLGRSQWNDPTFVGSYNEFRIYDDALSPERIALNATLGPDVLEEGQTLLLEVDIQSGHVQIVNAADVEISLDYYRISSAAGTLNPAAWNSLDRQNVDAADGADVGAIAGDSSGEGWDESGGSSHEKLIELFLGDAAATLNPGESISLGGAYDPSVFGLGVDGDLQFQIGLPGGTLASGSVGYVSNGLSGDVNFDGVVSGDDVLLVQRGFGSAYDGDDLATVVGSFGSQLSTISSVPEPSAAWMIVIFNVSLSTLVNRNRAPALGSSGGFQCGDVALTKNQGESG